MKNLKKLIALAITLSAFVLVGCSNISQNYSVDGKTKVSDAQTKSICLIAESDDNTIVFNDKDARTIMPNAANADTLKFYLVYRDTINSSTPTLESVGFNKDTTETDYTRGTVTKSFNLSSYEFILYALEPAQVTKAGTDLSYENIKTFASYIGTAKADLRYYDKVTFHLKVNTSTGGKGHLELLIENKDDWDIPANYQVLAGLYDDNDKLIYPTTNPKTIYERNTASAGHLDSTALSYIKSADETYDVPMGEWNFVVKYLKLNGSGETVATYEYSEKIIILMNEDTVATVTIPEILEKVPSAPSGFVVEYQNPSTNNSSYYPVQFKWADNSKTEREFKIEFLKINSAEAYYKLPTNDTEWTTITSSGTSIIYTKLAMQNSEYYIDGSLNKNSTSVAMYLPLGERYVARICAKNDAGDSSYAYVTWIATADTGWSKFDDAVQTINRFRITYNLGGGQFYDNAATPVALVNPASGDAVVPALVTYRSQYNKTASDAEASLTYNAILNPDGITTQKWFTDLAGVTETATASAITLALGKNYWDCWYTDNDSGTTKYPQTNAYQDSSTTFIGNIKYYPNGVTDDTSARTTALGSQPVATGFNGKYNNGTTDVFYKVRKVTMQLYTGYKNLNLIAHYDTTLTMNAELDDPSLYELDSEWILSAFAKEGTGAVNTAINAKQTPDTGASITNLEDFTDGEILEVSLGLVNQITFTLDTENAKFPVTTYNESSNTVTKSDGTYDNMHLKISKIGNTKDVKVDQDWNSSKAWTISFKTWTEGKYVLYFTATTSENPGHVYGKTVILQITD